MELAAGRLRPDDDRFADTAFSERRNKGVMAAPSTSPCPQPLDLPPRGPDVVMALNSRPNLPLTQGGCPERAVLRRVDSLDKRASTVVSRPECRARRRDASTMSHSPFANSMSTQPFDASDILSCRPPQVSPKVAGPKCAGEDFCVG